MTDFGETLLGEGEGEGISGLESVEMAASSSLRSRSNDLPHGTATFRDSRRRVDFVLVYNDEVDEGVLEKREHFHTSLRKAQLHLEEVNPEFEGGSDEDVNFVLIHAPINILFKRAEHLGWKMPLKEVLEVSSSESTGISACLDARIFHTPLDTHKAKPVYYTGQFRKDKLDIYLNSEQREKFFTSAQRSRLVYDILQNAQYGDQDSDIGIDRLLEHEVYTAAYPLHEGRSEPQEIEPGGDDAPETMRQELKHYWGRWGAFYKYQPLDHIREYFGEQVAFYFAWLGMYTVWLIPASILGLIVVIYGALTIPSNSVVDDTCNKNITICPTCDTCDPTSLSDACLYAKLTRLFDNELTMPFAVLMSFWATFFLEFWKRTTAKLAHRWDVMGIEEEAERPRPQYCIAASDYAPKENPITGINEPYFPETERRPRYFGGWSVISLMVVLLIIFVVGVIFYRTIVIVVLTKSSLTAEAPVLTSLTSSIISVVVILIMSNVYSRLAKYLTDWETHRTDNDYEFNLTLKMYLFEFLNYYSAVIYIAFFKGRFIGYPCHYNKIFGYRQEECAIGGCFYELAQQLLVILLGKQIFSNFMEFVTPKIKLCIQDWRRRKNTSYSAFTDDESEQWKIDYYHCEDFGGLFSEYLEMIIQFGFITVFVAAMPLAPLLALLNNIVEIRLDAIQFVVDMRRPVAMKADGIGIWQNILEFVVKLAVIANAFLIAFTSDIIPQIFYHYHDFDTNDGGNYVNYSLSWGYVHDCCPPNNYNNTLCGPANSTCRYRAYRYPDGSHTEYYYELLVVRLAFVLVFEHFVFFVSGLIDLIVPDIPRSLYLKIKRQEYLASKAFLEAEAQEEEHDMKD